MLSVPDGLVVRIRRSHRRGRGSIPRLGGKVLKFMGEKLLAFCSFQMWEAWALDCNEIRLNMLQLLHLKENGMENRDDKTFVYFIEI